MPLWLLFYQAALLVSGVSLLALGYVTWRNRTRLGARPFLVTLTGVFGWVGGVFVTTLFRTDPTALLGIKASYVASSIAVSGILLFALEYTGREEWLNRRTLAALAVEPVLVAALLATNDQHALFWSVVGSEPMSLAGFARVVGPAYYGHTIYAYGLMVVATVLLAWFVIDATAIYRDQGVAILGGIVVPWVSHLLYISGWLPVDATPIAFAISALLFGWAVLRAGFLDVAPIGRNVVVNDLSTGVCTIDHRDRVVDLNPAARRLFDCEDESVVGCHVDSVLAAVPELDGTFGGSDSSVEDPIEFGHEGRDYRASVSRLTDPRDRRIGRTILIHDVTEQKRRERALQEQNEKLERFASVVSHDLRNPLSVIAGRVQVARDGRDVDEQLAEIERNVHRIDDIIDEVLALTREEGTAEVVEADVAAVAREAWQFVETADASLSCPADVRVNADRSQLVQLFENLFKNAIDHAGDDVTVRVESLQEGGRTVGFAVVDDGPGIPATELDRVVEDGYTTSSRGTGLGLSIVSEITDGHGWDLRVAPSDEGARFEIRTGDRATAGGDATTVDQ